MDDAGAVFGRDEVVVEHLEAVGVVSEVREQRLVGPADEVGALERALIELVEFVACSRR